MAGRMRLQQCAERRLPALTRYRQPEPLPIALHRRRIYIVPTGFGVAFAILLLVMLIGALNYANNAALLLTCLVGATAAASMLMAFRTLDGLRLVAIRALPVIAGSPAELQLEFQSQRTRSAIRIDCAGQSQAFAATAQARTVVKLNLTTEFRGWLALPRIRLWSTWPFGLFRAWSWLYPQQSILVWPSAEPSGPPPRLPHEQQAPHQPLQQGEDIASLREYRHGDSQHRIAWKASARHEHLLVKDFEQPIAQTEWQLDWQQLTGLDDEHRIARLARWLTEAEAQQRACSLHLPGQTIAAGRGAAHYAQCMNALASLP